MVFILKPQCKAQQKENLFIFCLFNFMKCADSKSILTVAIKRDISTGRWLKLVFAIWLCIISEYFHQCVIFSSIVFLSLGCVGQPDFRCISCGDPSKEAMMSVFLWRPYFSSLRCHAFVKHQEICFWCMTFPRLSSPPTKTNKQKKSMFNYFMIESCLEVYLYFDTVASLTRLEPVISRFFFFFLSFFPWILCIDCYM